MSRSGRAIQLLDEWRAHPADCTKEHDPWDEDGSGVHGLDAWEVIVLLDDIDPMFHEKAEAERDALRAELDALRGRVAGLAERMTIELAGDIERRDEAGPGDHDYWNGVVGGSAWQAQALRKLLDGPA